MSAAVETLSLEGKVAIVTGAGRDSGIGAAIATALARNGAAVAINYFSDSTAPSAQAIADRLQTEYGAKAVPIQANVETEEGAAALVEKTLAAFGVDHIDIVVNNAGCNLPGSTDDTPWENIEAQFSKNVFAAVRVVRAALPHIPRGGRIVNISTIASRFWIEGLTFYGAAKAALDSLTHSWAAEVKIPAPFLMPQFCTSFFCVLIAMLSIVLTGKIYLSLLFSSLLYLSTIDSLPGVCVGSWLIGG